MESTPGMLRYGKPVFGLQAHIGHLVTEIAVNAEQVSARDGVGVGLVRGVHRCPWCMAGSAVAGRIGEIELVSGSVVRLVLDQVAVENSRNRVCTGSEWGGFDYRTHRCHCTSSGSEG